MHAARACAQQLLFPAAAGICGGTRASEAARPDFHRLSSVRQPPAPGGAVAKGDFDRPPARPPADEKARAVGGQTEAEYQQTASRAQGVISDHRERVGWRYVPARRSIRGWAMRRDREDEFDLADIRGEANTATPRKQAPARDT